MFRFIIKIIKKVFNTIKNAFVERPIPMIASTVIVAAVTVIAAPMLPTLLPSIYSPLSLTVKEVLYSSFAIIMSLYSMAIIINGESHV